MTASEVDILREVDEKDLDGRVEVSDDDWDGRGSWSLQVREAVDDIIPNGAAGRTLRDSKVRAGNRTRAATIVAARNERKRRGQQPMTKDSETIQRTPGI